MVVQKRNSFWLCCVLCFLFFVGQACPTEPVTNELPKESISSDSGSLDKGNNEKNKEHFFEQLVEKPVEQLPEKKLPTAIVWKKIELSTQNDLYSVAIPDTENAWVVGAQGSIYHSSDRGISWAKQTSSTEKDLYHVFFFNAKRGWAVGASGTIVLTEDGGQNWKVQPPPVLDALRGLYFWDENNGVCVGDKLTYLVTANAGKTWQPSSSGSNQIDLKAVHFQNSLNGVAVGSNGTVLTTNNGGGQLTNAITGTNLTFFAVHFVNTSKGWLVGQSGKLMTSSNGGQSWMSLEVGAQTDLYGVWFLNELQGWVVGRAGLFLKSSDGGASWSKETLSIAEDLHGLNMRSKEFGVLVGKKGTLYSLQSVTVDCNEGDTKACYNGASGTQGIGRCKAGVQHCLHGFWGSCQGEVTPATSEICGNGTDDNCNGKSDEEENCPPCLAGQTQVCFTGPPSAQGSGECATGIQTCQNQQWSACLGEVVPTQEECDGKDNDCNGKIDDIAPQNLPDCPLSLGVCKKTKQTCQAGKLSSCTSSAYGADYELKETKCDGKDNDCNGVIDESCPCKETDAPKSCYTGDSLTLGVGLCLAGTQKCVQGKWGDCQGQVLPQREVCGDGKDNNCNGKQDEKSQFALSFESRLSSSVSIAHSISLEPTQITVEAYVRFQSLGGRGKSILSKSQDGGYSLMIDHPNRGDISARIWLQEKKQYEWATTPYKNILSSKQWHHIAFTFDGKSLKLFVDGKKIKENQVIGTIGYSGTVPLLFGAEAGAQGVDSTSPLYWDGWLAEVRISNVAVYTKDFQPGCEMSLLPSTVALWKMNEGTGTTFSSSVGTFAGSLNQAVWIEQNRCQGYEPNGCGTP